jgi:outer membrane protein TolC
MKYKVYKRILCLLIVLAIFTSNYFVCYSKEEILPPDSDGVHPMFKLRSEEEKLAISDNIIEWDELDKIIHDCNPEVRNLWNNYETNKNNNDVTDSYMNAAENFDSLSNDASSSAQEAMYQAQSYAMQMNADNNVSDSLINYYSCMMQEASILLSTKKMFINYYKSKLLHEIAALSELEASREYNSAENKYSLGAITKVDALNAKVDYFTKQSETIIALSNFNQIKQNLLISLGKEYKDDGVIISPFPLIDFNIVTQTNPEMDKNNAVNNNYQYKIYLRSLSNSQTDAVKSKYQLLVNNAEAFIRADIETKFRSVKDSMNSLMLLQEKSLASDDDFKKISKEYKLGSVSNREYKTAEYKKEVAMKNAQVAYYDFAITYYDYLAAIDGLASAGVG